MSIRIFHSEKKFYSAIIRCFTFRHFLIIESFRKKEKTFFSSSQLQDQVTFFIIYFTLLIKTNFYLDYKDKELLNSSLFSMNNLKNEKPKKRSKRTLEFPNKFHLFKFF